MKACLHNSQGYMNKYSRCLLFLSTVVNYLAKPKQHCSFGYENYEKNKANKSFSMPLPD